MLNGITAAAISVALIFVGAWVTVFALHLLGAPIEITLQNVFYTWLLLMVYRMMPRRNA
jgi:hypothetical protein